MQTKHTGTGALPGVLIVVLVAAISVAGCSDDSSTSSGTGGDGTDPSTSVEAEVTTLPTGSPVVDPGDGGDYRPAIDPATFVETIDNPYMPLTPGSEWVYEGTSEDEEERVEIVVTDERRDVMGVSTVVVRDTVYVGGEMVEDTYDWFAQDGAGNVWYFGEEVKDYQDGEVVSTAGSWEAGVDGALPGIVMPADPAVGGSFRQEYLAGEAEDMFEILAIDGTAEVAAGDFVDVVITEDWSPIEPEVVENKYYAPGVGKILEEKTAGGEGRVELVSYTAGP